MPGLIQFNALAQRLYSPRRGCDLARRIVGGLLHQVLTFFTPCAGGVGIRRDRLIECGVGLVDVLRTLRGIGLPSRLVGQHRTLIEVDRRGESRIDLRGFVVLSQCLLQVPAGHQGLRQVVMVAATLRLAGRRCRILIADLDGLLQRHGGVCI